MDPTHIEKFTTTEKECSGRKTQQSHHTIMSYQSLLCLTHGNAEVERNLLENSKVLTSEQSLLCVDPINVIKLTKDAI